MWEHLPKLIVYTRHPQCLHNVSYEEGFRRGIENKLSPLTPLGIKQRDITAKYLLDTFGSFDAVYCSTYKRTRKIPEAAGMKAQLIEHSDLDERSMGVWHNLPRDEVLRKFPGEEEILKKMGYHDYIAPGGESSCEVAKRIRNFLSDKALHENTDCMYVSGHGSHGRIFRKVLTNASMEECKRWENLKNAAVSVYERKDNEYICTLYSHKPWEGLIEQSLIQAWRKRD